MDSGLEEAGGLLNDELGGEPIVAVYDSEAGTAIAYLRLVDGKVITFDLLDQEGWAVLEDRQTGSRWNLQGIGISGPLSGERLRFAPSIISEWYGWSAYHPETGLWTPQDVTGTGYDVVEKPLIPLTLNNTSPATLDGIEGVDAFPEVWSSNGYDGQTFEYKTNCFDEYETLDSCFLSEVSQVSVVAPGGSSFDLEKDFNVNGYSGEVTRRWVLYGPPGEGLPVPGEYRFQYFRATELVLEQTVAYEPEVIGFPADVSWSREGDDLLVEWTPSGDARPGMWHKVLVFPTDGELISQVFEWDSRKARLNDIPLNEGAQGHVNVAVYFRGGYAYSEYVPFVWSTTPLDGPPKQSETSQATPPVDAYGDGTVPVTFEVRVPEWTRAQDLILVRIEGYYFGAGGGVPMVRKGDALWTATYLAPADQALRYKYNRNDFGFSTDEQFIPDSDETRREVEVGTEPLLIRDRVSSWRWLPQNPPQAELSTFAPDSLPGMEDSLLLGAFPLDFYGDVFDAHVAPTMERLEQKGFEYVGIAYSAAVFIDTDPPKTTFEPINTYTEEHLGLSFAEVRRRGLKLALSVGVETDPRSAERFEEIEAGFRQEHDDRWYLELANEWELAMVRGARIAQENDVEILIISNQWPFWGYQDCGAKETTEWTDQWHDREDARDIHWEVNVGLLRRR